MRSIRAKQTGIFYPFFKVDGGQAAGFYDYVLFDDSTEEIFVPMLRQEFKGRACEARFAAHEAIGTALARVTGREFKIEQAAVSQGYDHETRTYTLNR